MTTPTSAGASAAPLLGDMPITQLLYGDLEQELANARRVLERVPDGQESWRPHEKSMTLGRLAGHVAELPGFSLAILQTDDFDLATDYKSATATSTAERLALFDEVAGALRAAIAAADEAALARSWRLRMGDHVILTAPKAGLVRSMGISHIVHHRAQLGVYLRLLGVPVPGLYGPSADEQ